MVNCQLCSRVLSFPLSFLNLPFALLSVWRDARLPRVASGVLNSSISLLTFYFLFPPFLFCIFFTLLIASKVLTPEREPSPDILGTRGAHFTLCPAHSVSLKLQTQRATLGSFRLSRLPTHFYSALNSPFVFTLTLDLFCYCICVISLQIFVS